MGTGVSLLSGAIFRGALLQVRVSAPADGSVLARIIRSVREAQAGKAPTQRFIDRFAARYTPLVVALAVLLAVALPMLGLLGWQAALYQSLVLLVIACPCALVIATPVTLVSARAKRSSSSCSTSSFSRSTRGPRWAGGERSCPSDRRTGPCP